MLVSEPKLRTDLKISRHGGPGEAYLVVKDPLSGEFFRFREAEQFIASRLDGETSLEVIRQQTEKEFGATLNPETLSAFVHRLDKNGLLETAEEAWVRRTEHPGRIRGSLLYLRIKLLDPAKLLDALLPHTRFFFTAQFLAFSAAVIAVAIGITISNWSAYAQDLARLYRLLVIPLFLGLSFLVVSAHEFAHGLTCRHFGGEVREMGFMLIYFQPALYCNVSDAWLFPEKSKRLWVGFAGPYFEMFLWAMATVVWRLTDSATWINYLALIVMTASGIKTLLNFSPLIKLDGYYLLSDYLGIPNLRKKSFRYVGGALERLFGLAPPARPEVSPRERRIFLSYGLSATIASFVLLSYILLTAGGYLIEIREPTLLCLLTGLIGVRLHRRFRRLFGRNGASDPEDDGEEWQQQSAATSRATLVTEAPPSEPPPAAKAKRKQSRSWPAWKRRRLLWMALAASIVALLSFGRMELRVAGSFNILPEENADARAAVEGVIEAILVEEGELIQAGEPIARLSGGALLAELRKTEAEIRENHSLLQKQIAGPTGAEIALSRAGVAKAEDQVNVGKATVAKAEDQLQYARGRLPRYEKLFEENLTSRMEYEEAQQLVVAAENELTEAQGRLEVQLQELTEAQGRLNVLLSGTRPEEMQATRARIERLEAQRRFLEQQLRDLKVTSPATGVVATPSRQLKQMRGQLVKKGDLIAKIYEFERVTAQILVPEKEIADVQVGQEVALRARAYPHQTFRGKVTFIATSVQGNPGANEPAPLGTFTAAPAPGERMVLVSTVIDNESLLLKPEMTGQAKIYCGQRRMLDLVLRRLARTIKVEFWSWW